MYDTPHSISYSRGGENMVLTSFSSTHTYVGNMDGNVISN